MRWHTKADRQLGLLKSQSRHSAEIQTMAYTPARTATRCGRSPLRTWHSHGAGLLRGVPDAQLPLEIFTPTLDSATRLDRARVEVPQCDDSGSRDVCRNG